MLITPVVLEDRLTSYDLTSDLNILLTGHKDQYIARWQRKVDLQDLLHCTVDVILARRFTVEDFDWECSPRNSIGRGLAIEIGELYNLSDR